MVAKVLDTIIGKQIGWKIETNILSLSIIKKHMNISEQEISLTLQAMKSKGKWITLQLQPEIGLSSIKAECNRMFINDGRDGKWEDVSESFYDEMVNSFDSRYSK